MGARSARPDDIERARRELEQWRRRRNRGRRIPESLWKAAVTLARRHGVSQTAQSLRLDYYALKRRLQTTAPSEPVREEPGRRFVELPLRAGGAGGAGGPACVVEVQEERGARLRLELHGLGAGELTAVVRSVWSR